MIVGSLEPPAEFNMIGAGGPEHELFIPFRTIWRAQPGVGVCPGQRQVAGNVRGRQRGDPLFPAQPQGTPPGRPRHVRIDSVGAFVETFNKVARAITMVAGGIVGISLLVGGVGIMTAMLVSVSERTREIGLRKAVGRDALGDPHAVPDRGGHPQLGRRAGGHPRRATADSRHGRDPRRAPGAAYIPIWAIIISIGFSAIIGVFFGIFPAVKAARLDPIDALRHE
ncbi:MAG: ABC transporter permease [Phycisphaerales bacterium]